MHSRSLGHRAPLLWLVMPFAAGLAIARVLDAGAIIVPVALAGGASAAAVVAAWRNSPWWTPAVVLALFAGGVASYAHERARLAAWETLPPREVKLALRIDRVFAQADPRRATGLATVMAADEHLRELAGQRLYFSLTLAKQQRAPVRSANISAVGVLTTLPLHPAANSFDGFLASAGMNFRLGRGRILGEDRPPLAYYRFCAAAAQRFKFILGEGIAAKRPTLAGLLRAMMLGETHELSEEQHTLFMQSGTMHLFAISGLNIAVIATSIQALLLLCRVPRAIRVAAGIACLWLFVDITGAAPSAVRAFVMAAFLQAAFVWQRPANPIAALAASALVVLLVSPLQLFSASFLMSYAIVLALLVLGLPLSDALLARWQPWRDVPQATWNLGQKLGAAAVRWLTTALAIGAATTLVSLLTSVEFFGLLTPGALFANLLLIPAAMAATLGGFASVLCGLIGFHPGAVVCNHAAALVLLAIEWLVRLSVKIPGAFLAAQFRAPWIGATALALLLATLVFGYAMHWRRERGGWWPPFVVVALALALGVKFG